MVMVFLKKLTKRFIYILLSLGIVSKAKRFKLALQREEKEYGYFLFV